MENKGANLTAISEMIADYERQKAANKEMEDALKLAKAETDRLEAQIIQLILDAEDSCGLDNLSLEVGGRKYGVAIKSYWRIPAAHKDDAFKLLREIGMGDLITERVDDRTLTREINDILEANKGELPDMYSGLHLEGYDKTTLTNRKA